MDPVTKVRNAAVYAVTGIPGPPPMVASTLDVLAEEALKIASFSFPGSGKTFFIVGLLLVGERVFVAETDMGGSGMATVRAELRRIGRTDLLKNVASCVFVNYVAMVRFLDAPEQLLIKDSDGKTVALWEWDPTFLIWEGVTNFQNIYVTQHILSHDARGNQDNVSAIRKAGLSLEGFGDFGALLQQTTAAVSKFLALHGPKHAVHKYMTFQSDDIDEDQVTKEVKRGPMIQGKARSHIVAGFDLIIEIVARRVGDKVIREFKCDVGGKSVAKLRGLNVLPVEPADSEALWLKIKPQGAVVVEVA